MREEEDRHRGDNVGIAGLEGRSESELELLPADGRYEQANQIKSNDPGKVGGRAAQVLPCQTTGSKSWTGLGIQCSLFFFSVKLLLWGRNKT